LSVVHAAIDIATGQPLAVKVLSPSARRNVAAIDRFLAEARLLARLRLPGIVRVSDYGVLDDGRPFMVMEFLDGRSLYALLEREGPLTWSRAKPLLLSACSALQAVHDADIVHRDVKPQNLFVLDDEGARDHRVRVLDFGLADDPQAPFTARGVGLRSSDYLLLGTPGFMAPEQVTDAEVDARADVYALGVTLFVMLTGRLPFVSEHPVRQMAEHMYVDPPRLRDVNPDIPTEVETLVLRAMAKDPAQRISSMRAFRWAAEQIEAADEDYPPLLHLGEVIDLPEPEPEPEIEPALDRESTVADATPRPVIDDDPTPLLVEIPELPVRKRSMRKLGWTMLSMVVAAGAVAWRPLVEVGREALGAFNPAQPFIEIFAPPSSALEPAGAPPWRPRAVAVVPAATREVDVRPLVAVTAEAIADAEEEVVAPRKVRKRVSVARVEPPRPADPPPSPPAPPVDEETPLEVEATAEAEPPPAVEPPEAPPEAPDAPPAAADAQQGQTKASNTQIETSSQGESLTSRRLPGRPSS
jgi:serine/threonine-protein kinase